MTRPIHAGELCWLMATLVTVTFQTVQSEIRWLLQEPSDLGLHCLKNQQYAVNRSVALEELTTFLQNQVSISLPRQINCLIYFSTASILKVLQCCSKLVKILSELDAKLLDVSSGSNLFAYGTLVVFDRLRVKYNHGYKLPVMHT